MSVIGKNLWWILGVAAGSAVALVATTQNVKRAKKEVSKSSVGDRYSLRTKNRYDDSEGYCI